MILYSKKEECCGCGACVDICPVNAIHMVSDREGFSYPHIDRRTCIKCGKCVSVCPLKDKEKIENEHKYYGVWAKDEKVRYSSSSGGIFSVLAQYIFGQQGVVYGAGYGPDMKVMHKETKDERELEQIKRTKYVQSSMDSVYCSIEKRLKNDQWVLFCGTPCQAHALRLFLKKSYEKLVIVDLVCYGVPSPGIWEDYIKYIEEDKKGKMTEFSFRDKRNKDHGRTRSYIIDGVEYAGPHGTDEFCLMYFRNYILRPSCHKCTYCNVDRGSDITIGDFWGIEKVKPEMDDSMGTSLVILHTDKGKKLWNCVEGNILKFECEKQDVLQPRLKSPTASAKRRWLFMILYRILPFSFMIKIMHDARFRRVLK